MTVKNALSIAGSDPSGGAGIQADLKTFTTLGVYGAAAITCLTVQNTQQVYDSFFLEGRFVKAQIDAVLSDIEIGFIKTGMLGNADIAEAVGSSIEGYFTVCDPVMISKSGFPLMEERAMDAMKSYVISRARLLTPNFHELLKLSGRKDSEPITAGKILMDKYPSLQALLVKGGHIDETGNTVTDTLIVKDTRDYRLYPFSHQRYQTKNTHGTGCTLSSAITAFLAKGEGLSEAANKAIDFTEALIEKASQINIGRGNGPLPHHLA